MTLNLPTPSSTSIAVIGLGYVGLPLAIEFGKHFATIGYDINANRIAELREGRDVAMEVDAGELAAAHGLHYVTEVEAIRDCNIYIVTVPTPIDEHKRPDFTPLVNASRALGKVLKRGDVVIYESTVYPGATEEICIPELERASSLVLNRDFAVGYSPERISPGDRKRSLSTIPKITSGSTPEAADFVDGLYARIISAGTYKASSIKVAEACKVIENVQRDANIALINEFALIFHRLGIDTNEVLQAAATKWNFLPFKPGLVGGHCIGVDPYYLIQKAQSVGYHPDILLACRRINDAMGQHVAAEVIKLMIQRRRVVAGARVLVLGFTFKENCADARNTRVAELVRELEQFSVAVDVYDPYLGPEEVLDEYGIRLLPRMPPSGWGCDAIIIAVSHEEFEEMGVDSIRAVGGDGCIIYDIKGMFAKESVDGRL